MTNCKQAKQEGNLTPQPPSLLGKGEQEGKQDQIVIPAPSPTKRVLGSGSASFLTPSPSRRGLGSGYLYLLQKSFQAKSSGFTIIECLLAIIMVGILMTAIAPVIVLSVATRVQARRVEQATMAGRNYIDAVQSGTVPKPESTVPLYEVDPTTKEYVSARDIFAAATAPPQQVINCLDDRGVVGSIYPYCDNGTTGPTSLYCVDNDGGGCTSSSNRDYIVQAFRSVRATAPGVPDPEDTGNGGYVLGVRVYRADAFDGATPLQTTNLTPGNKKVATYTGGKGNQFAPLAEFTTEVRPSAGKGGSAMQSLCDRLGGCVNTTTPP